VGISDDKANILTTIEDEKITECWHYDDKSHQELPVADMKILSCTFEVIRDCYHIILSLHATNNFPNLFIAPFNAGYNLSNRPFSCMKQSEGLNQMLASFKPVILSIYVIYTIRNLVSRRKKRT
jgi:hypothetical protein